MEKLLQGSMLKRFVIYPLVFLLIWGYVFKNLPDFFLVKFVMYFIDTAWVKTLKALNIPVKFYQFAFGFLFGYVYGTISMLFKVRSFRGLTMFVLFYVKIIVSMIVTSMFGFLYIVELIGYSLFKFVMFKLKNRHIKKINKNQRLAESELFYQEVEKIISK